MSAFDLEGFVNLLEESGDLCRISVEVDPDLEISTITDRVCKRSDANKALLFEKVKGYSFPVVTNLFGSHQRMAWALWTNNIDALAKRLEEDVQAVPGRSIADRLRALVDNPSYLPQMLPKAACHEVVYTQNPSLEVIPAIKGWPGDGGRFLTLPLVITKDPASGRVNYGMYRVQISAPDKAVIHWGKGSDAALHYSAYLARGKKMPAAIVLGGEPIMLYVASMPLPKGIDEAAFAGYLRQTPIKTTRCVTNDLQVPAQADVVIEGYFQCGETELTGPFGNHTGYYTPASEAPLFHVTAITHRTKPVVPCTVVGPPPMEDCYMAKATERLFLPLIRQELPEVRDINLPMEGIFHNCALLSVEKQGREHIRSLIQKLWAAGPLKGARLLILFDAEVDVQNVSECFWRAINNVDLTENIVVRDNCLAVDATAKDVSEGGRVPLRKASVISALVDQRWADYGID